MDSLGARAAAGDPSSAPFVAVETLDFRLGMADVTEIMEALITGFWSVQRADVMDLLSHELVEVD